MRSALHSRNGPPDAVIVMVSIVVRVARADRLKQRVMLGIHRQHASRRRARPCRMTAAPAHTRVSLLASATVRPAAIAAKVGSNPAAPTIAETTRSASRNAASFTASGAGGDFDLEPRESRLQLRIAGWVGEGGEFGAELDRAFAPAPRRRGRPRRKRPRTCPARRR